MAKPDFLNAIKDAFSANKRYADQAILQVSETQLREIPFENGNSIAILIKHIAGNFLSRWTDFLLTDGEKPYRNRDNEFIDSFESAQEVFNYWEEGWECLFKSLDSLTEEDLKQTVLIRGQSLPVPKALERSLGHACFHIGQIVLLSRMYAGSSWISPTIPRGKSDSFNKANWGKKDASHS